jgi:hypothetical protein
MGAEQADVEDGMGRPASGSGSAEELTMFEYKA